MMRRVFFAIFVFSLLALLPVSMAQELATGDFIRTYPVIKPAVAKTITENVLTSAGTPVYELRIDVKNLVVQARINIEPTDPEEVSLGILPGGVVFDYFNVSARNIENQELEKLTMSFRVPTSWMEENNVDAGTVKLLRLNPGAWVELETSIISNGTDTVSYQADSESFSMFAIVGESNVVDTEEVVREIPQEAEQEVNEETDIVEIKKGESAMEKRARENLTLIVSVALVIIIAVFFFVMPGSFIRKKLRR